MVHLRWRLGRNRVDEIVKREFSVESEFMSATGSQQALALAQMEVSKGKEMRQQSRVGVPNERELEEIVAPQQFEDIGNL
jgi:hypothetical protein